MGFKYSEIKRISKHMRSKFNIPRMPRINYILGWDCIHYEYNGEIYPAYAAYNTKANKIDLPLGTSRSTRDSNYIYRCFAHELAHAYQIQNKLDPTETQAESIAIEVLNGLGIKTYQDNYYAEQELYGL